MTVARRPRLLVTTGTLPAREDDGEPRFVADLARAMQRHMDVTVLAPAHAQVPLHHDLNGVPVVRYRYAPLRTLERIAYPGGLGPRLKRYPAMWALVPGLFLGLGAATAWHLRRGGFDCVHCHWAIPQGYVQSLLNAVPPRTPYMLTLHGGDVYTGRGGWRRAMIKRAMRGASAVTAVSDALRHEVWQGGFAPRSRPIDVIPMGCDLGAFGPEHRSPDLAGELGLAGPLILFVGRLAEKKGVGVLLETMASDALRERACCALIVGDGPLRAELETKARRLGLERRVRFHGAVAHRELPRLYASADVFCAPSVVARNGDCEGLPTVLSEAGASGLPVVASRVGGIPEIITDGVNGRLVPPGDAATLAGTLAHMLDDRDARARLGSAGRATAARFDWGMIADRFADVVARAVGRPRADATPVEG